MGFKKIQSDEHQEITPIFSFKDNSIFEGKYLGNVEIEMRGKLKKFFKFLHTPTGVEYLMNQHYIINELVNVPKQTSDTDTGECFTDFCLANYSSTLVRIVYLGKAATKSGNQVAKFQVELDYMTIKPNTKAEPVKTESAKTEPVKADKEKE